ncbi:MAG: hypothetical protein ACFE0Q_13475 [Anaerolineae bacterium]
MIIFIIFVLASILLGIGVMLAPALSTQQPQVGIATTLALALVIGGGTLWARWVQWDTLVIDYLVFGLVSLVVLGGTMVQAGADDTPGRLHRDDWLFFALLAALSVGLAFFPLSDNDQTALTLINSITSDEQLTFPNIETLSIGSHVLTAYLSQQLNQDVTLVYRAVLSVLSFLLALLAHDFSMIYTGRYGGRIIATGTILAVMIGTWIGLITLILTALLFGITSVVFLIRARRYRRWQDVLALFITTVAWIITSPFNL